MTESEQLDISQTLLSKQDERDPISDYSSETKLIHSGRDERYTQKTVNPIVQRASSVIFDSLDEKSQAARLRHKNTLFYGRRGTLTHFALREALCELEGGAGCALYPSGAAAISNSILAFIESGDHVLMSDAAYEPSQDFCQAILKKLNVETTFFNPNLGEAIADLIQPNTKVLFLESPSSITMEVQDIPSIVKSARIKNPNIIIMCDNTWGAGLLLKPLAMGVDISIQSGTKYMIGHSDFMLGTAVSNARCWDMLREQSYAMGQNIDADTAYMAARGLRTLAVRLKQHEINGLKVANWLATLPFISRVLHPALESCDGYAYFNRDFTGSSGLFSFVFTERLTTEQLEKLIKHCKLFKMAFSWGGFESLILPTQPEELQSMRRAGKINIEGTLIRLHIGLESPEDLINDLKDAFRALSLFK